MKRYFYPIIFMVVSTACGTNTSERTDTTDTLNQTLDQFNSAFHTCDIETLNRLTTDSYLHINGSSDPITKKEWINYLHKRKKQVENGELQISRYDFQDKKIQVYGQSAWVTGLVLVDGSLNHVPFSRKIRVSNVWVRENGQWKRAGFHDASMP